MATATAPAIVRAGSLMRINPRIITVSVPRTYIKHMGLGMIGGAALFPGIQLPAIGIIHPLNADQKLPPGWEYCDESGILLPSEPQEWLPLSVES